MGHYDGEKGPEAIEPDRLIDGHVYRIYARNGNVGIFRKHLFKGMDAFEIARNKFGYCLDFEYEWEQDEHFGTAYAVKDLGPAPKFETDEEKLKFLLLKEQEYFMDREEEHSRLARYHERERKFALHAIDTIRKALIPPGHSIGWSACPRSIVETCVYAPEDHLLCIYCGTRIMTK